MEEKNWKLGDVVVSKVPEKIIGEFKKFDALENELFLGLQHVGIEKKATWRQIYKDFNLPNDSVFELNTEKKQIIFKRKLMSGLEKF